MIFNQYLITFFISLFLIPACYGMEKENESENQKQYVLIKDCQAQGSQPKGFDNLPKELIAYIAHFLIENGNPLRSMHNLSRFARTSKRNFAIIMHSTYCFLPTQKLRSKARYDKENGQTGLGPWKNWN